mmetsp:Transcript_10584/g.65121  ORF Transcript_10584/g.65121 Transcript_10584/m.65121 type:complete len:233 (+) Transcript_10584:2930-3628(+)
MVPVLSEQITVAPPMVSHAARARTKLLSFIIFFMEYASDIVTAKGRPSGTATTTMVTLKRKNRTTSLNLSGLNPPFSISQWVVNVTKQIEATAIPSLPMLEARCLSFSCKGVSSPSLSINPMVLPHSDLFPTPVTNMVPLPSVTCVPARQNGSLLLFCTGSLSPVNAASSTLRWSEAMSRPSATILSPISSTNTSPQTTLVEEMRSFRPLRTTLTEVFSFVAFSSRNCFSFW